MSPHLSEYLSYERITFIRHCSFNASAGAFNHLSAVSYTVIYMAWVPATPPTITWASSPPFRHFHLNNACQ